nr:serine/threonine-protein phosphatase 7 long form like [Quercus suber]
MVDEHVIAIVRLLGVEHLHMVPSIKFDYVLITAFVEQWHPKTHSFHLPHGEMTITLQDVEVIMGMPIESEAMKVPPAEGVYGPPPPPTPTPLAMKWAGAKCTKNTHTRALRISQSNCRCTARPKFHLPDRVLRQFGLKQERPEDVDTNHKLHKIDVRSKFEKNWRVEYAFHIQKWNDHSEYVCHVERIEEVMLRHHPYMVWYRRITQLYIDHDSAKMEISIANQLAILSSFNEDSKE